MATLKFYTNDTEIGASEGLGFYGDSGFGASVPVSSYQGTTFITNAAGTLQGAQGDNITYLNAGSGLVNNPAGTGIGIDAIPYTDATLKINFEHTSQVKVQNAEVRVYDRYAIANVPSGVTTQAAEIVHPWATQSPVTTGSGVNDGKWYTISGDTTLSLSPSPGPTGVFVGGGSSTYTSTVHDWYVALSASPNSIGSKTQYGLYVALEYL